MISSLIHLLFHSRIYGQLMCFLGEEGLVCLWKKTPSLCYVRQSRYSGCHAQDTKHLYGHKVVFILKAACKSFEVFCGSNELNAPSFVQFCWAKLLWIAWWKQLNGKGEGWLHLSWLVSEGPWRAQELGLTPWQLSRWGAKRTQPARLPEGHCGIAPSEQAIKVAPLALLNKQLLISFCLRGEGVPKELYPNIKSCSKLWASDSKHCDKTSLMCFSSCNTLTEQQLPINTMKSLIPRAVVSSSITTRRAGFLMESRRTLPLSNFKIIGRARDMTTVHNLG